MTLFDLLEAGCIPCSDVVQNRRALKKGTVGMGNAIKNLTKMAFKLLVS
jgi:hypothetical protein